MRIVTYFCMGTIHVLPIHVGVSIIYGVTDIEVKKQVYTVVFDGMIQTCFIVKNTLKFNLRAVVLKNFFLGGFP